MQSFTRWLRFTEAVMEKERQKLSHGGGGLPPLPPDDDYDGGDSDYWSWGWIDRHYGEIIKSWATQKNRENQGFKTLILNRLFQEEPEISELQIKSNRGWQPDTTGKWGTFGTTPPPPQDDEVTFLINWTIPQNRPVYREIMDQVREMIVRAGSLWTAMGMEGSVRENAANLAKGQLFPYIYIQLLHHVFPQGNPHIGNEVAFEAFDWLKRGAGSKGLHQRLTTEIAQQFQVQPYQVQVVPKGHRLYSMIMEDIFHVSVKSTFGFTIQ